MTTFAAQTGQTTPGYPEIMKYRIFPAHKNGRCLKGFCPTLVNGHNNADAIFELASNLFDHNIKYDHIVVEQYE